MSFVIQDYYCPIITINKKEKKKITKRLAVYDISNQSVGRKLKRKFFYCVTLSTKVYFVRWEEDSLELNNT